MTGANVMAALLFFAASSLGIGLLELALDKLRIPARWRLWYHKTFKNGGRKMAHCKSCMENAAECLCNTCVHDDDGFCCIVTHEIAEDCPLAHCDDYEKEASAHEPL